MRTWIIGRDPSCELTLNEPSVSRRHAELRAEEGGRFEITDLGSSNGTWLRAGGEWRRITEPTSIGPEDPLRLGTMETTVVALIGGGDRASGPPAFNPTQVIRRSRRPTKRQDDGKG